MQPKSLKKLVISTKVWDKQDVVLTLSGWKVINSSNFLGIYFTLYEKEHPTYKDIEMHGCTWCVFFWLVFGLVSCFFGLLNLLATI